MRTASYKLMCNMLILTSSIFAENFPLFFLRAFATQFIGAYGVSAIALSLISPSLRYGDLSVD